MAVMVVQSSSQPQEEMHRSGTISLAQIGRNLLAMPCALSPLWDLSTRTVDGLCATVWIGAPPQGQRMRNHKLLKDWATEAFEGGHNRGGERL